MKFIVRFLNSSSRRNGVNFFQGIQFYLMHFDLSGNQGIKTECIFECEQMYSPSQA